MAVLHKETEYALIAVIVAVALLVYKKFQPGLSKAYGVAVDGTANAIAGAIGLTAKEAELDKPAPAKNSPEYNALIVASKAWHDGKRVDETTWRLALDFNPTNPVMLRAGKSWGYGSYWTYWGKDF